jgi:hypothetical protein
VLVLGFVDFMKTAGIFIYLWIIAYEQWYCASRCVEPGCLHGRGKAGTRRYFGRSRTSAKAEAVTGLYLMGEYDPKKYLVFQWKADVLQIDRLIPGMPRKPRSFLTSKLLPWRASVVFLGLQGYDRSGE